MWVFALCFCYWPSESDVQRYTESALKGPQCIKQKNGFVHFDIQNIILCSCNQNDFAKIAKAASSSSNVCQIAE
ncbi:hypothetical protein RHMOL_Rhmol03G0142200 [Rhododendron molle]|uniref:Uncharacterized protein n=1 Tax=Rhododendron molle TaxID=49168 RepID=A0ACC0PGG0_RHOML|nr:hypothetical protein RHMOL_Rhmol03G0142200 [Rhododendron molle]